VVVLGKEKYPVEVGTAQGGYDVIHKGETYALRSDWKLGEIRFRGTCNGEPICMQVERIGLKYRISHWGTRVDAIVMTARASDLLARMSEKVPADMSKYLLSPMPGLLREVSVKPGQEVRAGEKLAVIEAMKMENILKAELDGKVAHILAQPGESLSVDQPILEFASR
jgi:propionyl-CoA carboxylase alpha chain